VSKGYTTPAAVAAYLGRTLTTDQQALIINTLIPAVEEWIDGMAGRAWAATGSAAAEYVRVVGDEVSLASWPVLAVTSVTAYSGVVGEAGDALVTGTDYELRNAARGLLVLDPGVAAYRYLLVQYTYDYGALPSDLTLAATMIVADWLQPALNVDSYGISEYQVGQDLRVKYAVGGVVGSKDWTVPQAALDIIDRYRTPASGAIY
jgi:hypothetical protein